MKLIMIGVIGSYSVYVNTNKEDAIEKFKKEYPLSDITKCRVEEITVKNDKFYTYEIWEEES